MKALFQKMYDEVKNGHSVVLFSIVASSGSTPRGEGARMILTESGEYYGTIGGGAVEYKSQQLAKEVLESKRSYTKGFVLAPNEVEDLGMICGGDVVVYFQYFAGGEARHIALLEKILAVFDRDCNSWIITEVSEDTAGEMCVYVQGEGLIGEADFSDQLIEKLVKSRSKLTTVDGRKYYVEPLTKAGKVYIFGGGHIAQELVPVLSHIEFTCVVLDDREQFSNPQLFPDAEATYCCDFDHIADSVQIGPHDYVVIITRGHSKDYEAVEQALHTEAAYIGMIGSKTKTAVISKKLIEDNGFTEADLQRIYTPIGLPIKAETPAEIAISIAGEMLRVRAELKSL